MNVVVRFVLDNTLHVHYPIVLFALVASVLLAFDVQWFRAFLQKRYIAADKTPNGIQEPVAFRVCSANIGGILFNSSISYSLPFKSNKFNLVRLSNLSASVPENRWEHLLMEVHRVLKPHGKQSHQLATCASV